MEADIQIFFISCARKDTRKKEMAGLGEVWQPPTEHGGNVLSESFWLDHTASCKWHWVMEEKGWQAFHYQEWALGNVSPDLSQPFFLYAGKPTCFTGQSRALVFSEAGICKEEGLRSSVAFYSHLLMGGIGLESSKTLLPPVLLQDPAGQGIPWASGNSGPSLCWCWRLSWLQSSATMVQAPGRGVTLSPAAARCKPQLVPHAGLPLPGWQAGCSWPPLLLAGWHCCFCLRNANRLSLRIGQEKSTNSNRKSKCPLQTCTRYEAIQHKEKNQMLDNEDYIMLWMNTWVYPDGAMPTGPDGSGMLTA